MNNISTMHWIAAGVTGIYGLVSLIGGIMGYMKGSTVSLIAGGIAGILLLICAFGVPRLPVWSLAGAIVVSLALLGKFGVAVVSNFDLSERAGVVAFVMTVGGVLVILAAAVALAASGRPPTGA
jgi:uncharacterized membrane protein (UPF0136 family)